MSGTIRIDGEEVCEARRDRPVWIALRWVAVMVFVGWLLGIWEGLAEVLGHFDPMYFDFWWGCRGV